MTTRQLQQTSHKIRSIASREVRYERVTGLLSKRRQIERETDVEIRDAIRETWGADADTEGGAK